MAFWVPVGPTDDWPAALIEAGQLDFLVVPEGPVAAVLGLLSGGIAAPCFPAGFAEGGPVFEVWSSEGG
ncbi:hypothetical protein GCM10017752_41820 [Streptomyces roseoviridis]